LNTGGVAYYAAAEVEGTTRVHQRAMVGMEKVWCFIAKLIRDLDVAQLIKPLKAVSAGAVIPPQLTSPQRVRPWAQRAAVSSAADTRSSDELAWRLLQKLRQDDDDIANLADLGDMEVSDPLTLCSKPQDRYQHMYT
jgi:hypothetical protein